VISRQLDADRQTLRIEDAEQNVPAAPVLRKVPILRIVSATSDE
jgi:hypothetical protein